MKSKQDLEQAQTTIAELFNSQNDLQTLVTAFRSLLTKYQQIENVSDLVDYLSQNRNQSNKDIQLLLRRKYA